MRATAVRTTDDGIFNLGELLPPDLATDDSVRVPPWAFRPDHWNAAFLRGLRALAPTWSQRRVWEVGVGTGINLLVLTRWAPDAHWAYSDYDPRCVPLAKANLEAAIIDRSTRFSPLFGSWDLVTPPLGCRVPTVDVLFGCLPQVPAHIDLTRGDRRAHYYDPDRYREAHTHALGLGLNEALLLRARDVLLPGGSVVLNLGGRPGIDRLNALFAESGYEARIVHEEVVPQHAGTSLATLADFEAAGHAHFEFFADDAACVPLNASEAENRRISGEALFHKIYVMEGKIL